MPAAAQAPRRCWARPGTTSRAAWGSRCSGRPSPTCSTARRSTSTSSLRQCALPHRGTRTVHTPHAGTRSPPAPSGIDCAGPHSSACSSAAAPPWSLVSCFSLSTTHALCCCWSARRLAPLPPRGPPSSPAPAWWRPPSPPKPLQSLAAATPLPPAPARRGRGTILLAERCGEARGEDATRSWSRELLPRLLTRRQQDGQQQ